MPRFNILFLCLLLSACGETRRHAGKGKAQNADATGKSPARSTESTAPTGRIDDDEDGDPSGHDAISADASDDEDPAISRELCQAPNDASFELQTIDDVVQLVNQLPFPVSLPCLLDVLPRPLRIVATSSGLSIQPALDEKNPRIFALTGQLVLAVVPNGPSASLLELSQILSSGRSVKAEIVFPVTAALDAEEPFAHTAKVDASPGTRCAFCHGSETVGADGHYESRALRPVPASVIPYLQTVDLVQACARDPSLRCEILKALFGPAPGDVVEGKFPTDMPTMF